VLVFAIFGAVLPVYRLRCLAFERDVLRLQAEAAAAEHLARDCLRLRDYTNTPMQIKSYESTKDWSPSGEYQSSTSSK
jgi:hypothetical protein